MKLQQLRFLNAVVKHGLNITIAADMLYTSQPGVSKQIRLLEDELGMKLFVRRGKRIEALTPAGEQVARRAERILAEVGGIKALAEEMRGESRGQLSLGTTQTQARYVLPRVIDTFRKRFPDVDFDLHQGTSEQIARMIDERRIDFAMLSGNPEAFSSIRVLPIYQWDRVILVPRDHALVSCSRPLDLATLARYPLVTYLFSDRPESSLMSSFGRENLIPRVAFTARDADVIKTYVRMGMGVGILASMAVEEGTDDDLVAIDATGLFPRLTTWIGFNEELLLKAYHRDFIGLLAPHFTGDVLEDLDRHGHEIDVEARIRKLSLPLRTSPMVRRQGIRGC